MVEEWMKLEVDPCICALRYCYVINELVATMVLALANGSTAVLTDKSKAIDRAFPASGGLFSGNLQRLIMMLLSKPGQRQTYPTIHDLLALINNHTIIHL